MATKIIRPTGDDYNASMSDQDGGTTDLYSTIDESTASDLDYVKNSAPFGGCLLYLEFEAHGLLAGDTINSLKFCLRIYSDANAICYNRIVTNSATYDSAGVSDNGSYQNYSYTYNENPDTSEAWTVSELTDLCNADADLRAGIYILIDNSTSRVSQYYIEIDYTEAYKKFGTITWSSVKKIAGVVEANIKKLGKITKLI